MMTEVIEGRIFEQSTGYTPDTSKLFVIFRIVMARTHALSKASEKLY